MARQNGERRGSVGARPAPTVPDKLCFRIGEVARICAVPSYVLRFWEREFPQLRPAKGGTGQRLYRRRDVEMALRVRHLLYEEGYTIPGARQWLREGGRGSGEAAAAVDAGAGEDVVAAKDVRLRAMRTELEAIVRLLGRGQRGRTVKVVAAERRQHSARRGGGVLVAGSLPLFAALEGAGGEERRR